MLNNQNIVCKGGYPISVEKSEQSGVGDVAGNSDDLFGAETLFYPRIKISPRPYLYPFIQPRR